MADADLDDRKQLVMVDRTDDGQGQHDPDGRGHGRGHDPDGRGQRQHDPNGRGHGRGLDPNGRGQGQHDPDGRGPDEDDDGTQPARSEYTAQHDRVT